MPKCANIYVCTYMHVFLSTACMDMLAHISLSLLYDVYSEGRPLALNIANF